MREHHVTLPCGCVVTLSCGCVPKQPPLTAAERPRRSAKLDGARAALNSAKKATS